MNAPALPICVGCTHLRGSLEETRCDAFPDGIPDAILFNDVDHREPFMGDHGIVFDPRTPADAEYAENQLT